MGRKLVLVGALFLGLLAGPRADGLAPTYQVVSDDFPPHRYSNSPVEALKRSQGPLGPFERYEAAIIRCESGGDPKGQNPQSSASGLYQIIGWAGHGGYKSAADAPPSIQREKALMLYESARARGGSGFEPWESSRSCWYL